MKLEGLTRDEVESRIRDGKVNIVPKSPSRTIPEIIRANVFTIFNALNLGLSIVVICAGSVINSTFGLLIIVNALIGIVQELNAKKIIDKLSVLNRSKIAVIRDGEKVKLGSEEIVEDDVIYICAGQQIPADAEVMENNEIEVDESLLTGESEPIVKREGEYLMGGSFVVSGGAYVKVVKVGSDTYAAKLSREAKKYKKINSTIQKDINKIFKVITWIVIPSSILLVSTQLIFTNRNWREAVLGAVSGVVGMVPEGLVLLTSATFIVAVVRLAKWKALIQELPATEVLAMVDTICLDKTGTITEGILEVQNVEVIDGCVQPHHVMCILNKIIGEMKSYNQTDNAIANKCSECYNANDDAIKNLKCTSSIPFSSKRKWSAITLENDETYIMGAPEIILSEGYEQIQEVVEEEASLGNRVLLLAKMQGRIIDHKIVNPVNAVALVILRDVIKKEAPEIISYFYKEGVDLKIISGDNPITVASIAKKVGIKDADNYVDATELPDDIEELSKLVEDIKVFGRVTPHKKRDIIKALQNNKHIVAMTGDGINDVLALKESDCGIAMANGAQAAKAVSQIVLMNSNFSALPEIVLEGRRCINNLKRVAELFLTKTMYSIILSIVFALICKPFPLIPIQLSLIGTTTIGIPAFFLAMGPNKEKLEKGFLRKVLKEAIPNGIVIAIATIFVYVVGMVSGLNVMECRTLSVTMLGVISLLILLKVASPVTPWKIALVASMIMLYVLSFITSAGRYIFRLKCLSYKYLLLVIVVTLLCLPLIKAMRNLFNRFVFVEKK
ncbi:cation-transporting ATPase E [Hathewaya proteolytica DSM 3090]|uniref:Cation-transporting ATPase E n=1 Tax=Hathewaya proteolytica DSM 3090 TaxID=1121331 RepID=A0A1M6MH22_9CLOT|nr:HAD-IC family P-type ATPase [Hathewaya proteolytica]SHJ82656.1 cation-transporting ATPase E [Hathewaya proteolytica DSM 3090]